MALLLAFFVVRGWAMQPGIEGFQPHSDAIYALSAALGHAPAQVTIAASWMTEAERLQDENPNLAAEHMVMAEAHARLAYQHNNPAGFAILSVVCAMRSLQLAATDPVRSLRYREEAEALFDLVFATGDPWAVTVMGGALARLADTGDVNAENALDRAVALLPAESAVFLREWAKDAQPGPNERAAIAAAKGE